MTSWSEASARARVAGLLDPGSFIEFVPPAARMTSPHLAAMGLPVAFDDGVVVGRGRLGGQPVLVAAQEGGFMGGAVGEVHGAKIAALLDLACEERPAAVLLALESGGVRLHEANAGLIAVSEIMRATLAARAAGVPVMALGGGRFGIFGGIGIVAGLCDAVILSEEGRLGLSGPEVIETEKGVEEFDSRDRALVWRVTGGKHRYLMGDAAALVPDTIAAFRQAALAGLSRPVPLDLAALDSEQALLSDRVTRFADVTDPAAIWAALGWPETDAIALMETEDFLHMANGRRMP